MPSPPPRRRDLSPPEVDAVHMVSGRIKRWNTAYNECDLDKIRDYTAAVCAAFVHCAELAGAENVLATVFAKIDRLDNRHGH